MAMRDGFKNAKSTADLRERKWSSSYCFHRARSCHSCVWSFEITAALKSRGRFGQLVGGEASQGRGVTLNKGGNASHGQWLAQEPFADCTTGMLRETPSEKHQSVNWNRLVRCQLSHTNKSLSSPMSYRQWTCSPKRMIWASEHHGETGEPWTGKWVWEQLHAPPKAASAPRRVSIGLSAAQNYRKSPLMSISKSTVVFCLHFISLSLYFQSFWVTRCRRMLFWLSCMFSLSADDERLPQTLRCPWLCHFSGRLFPTLQGHPVLFKPLSWRSTRSPLSSKYQLWLQLWRN